MTNAVAHTARQVRSKCEELLGQINSNYEASNEALTDYVERLAAEVQVLASAVAVLADAVDGESE